MLNIHELETRWLHYKIKSYTPYAIVSIIIIAGITIAFSFDFNTKSEITTYTSKEELKKEIVKKVIPTVEVKQVSLEDTQENTKTLISPSFNFMDSMRSSSPSYATHKTKTYKKTKANTKKDIKVKPTRKIVKKEIKVEVPKVEVVKKNLINIKRRNTQKDIQHVIARFKKSNNPALSLFIAKKYYELKDYDQAYNYALITNGLNNDIEESWIIFAKSLFMLNKRAKAIETLDRYIKYSHSFKAKLLLDKIRLGKLK